ncbi:MAG: hypothetical protein ACREIS_05630 [Nitrospiraceae bacterium]
MSSMEQTGNPMVVVHVMEYARWAFVGSATMMSVGHEARVLAMVSAAPRHQPVSLSTEMSSALLARCVVDGSMGPSQDNWWREHLAARRG